MLLSWVLFVAVFAPAVLATFSLGHRKGHRCGRSYCWLGVSERVGRHGRIGVSRRL
jgi:hypothetical protein